MAAWEICERLHGNGYPWKRVKDRYKNGQPKVSPDSFQYGLRYPFTASDASSYLRRNKT
jgi:hypothetical protein